MFVLAAAFGVVMRATSWISLGLVALYLLNTYVLFLHGE
jgi:hypothetical protein